jgi:hypothetical protein
VSGFRLRVRLDPAPDHRAQLAAYPDDDLWPDFAVVTSGMIAIDLGPHAIGYRHGRLTPLPAGTASPAAWLPDYLGGLLHRLASAVRQLQPGQSTTAHLLDAPAALTFAREEDDQVTVSYVSAGRRIYTVRVPLAEVRAAVAGALDEFLTALLAINPRLAGHPDVVALQAHRAALAGSA